MKIFPMDTVSLQFINPPLEALRTTHRGFALISGKAWKYPAEVTPFSAIESDSVEAWRDLLSLMKPGEATYVITDAPPTLKGLSCEGPLWVKQMIYPEDLPLPNAAESSEAWIEPLSCADADAMVQLTSIAFPGFFRVRTCEMGNYYGIRVDGQLAAMCGERMAIRDYREISGLCTHPDFRGRGYAAMLMARLMRDHRHAGLRSYLHVSAGNLSAIALYERMGFMHRGEFPMYLATRQT